MVVGSIFYRDSGSGPAKTNALPAIFGFSCGWLASNQWDFFVSALVGELVWTCLRDD
jgi:polysaccharide pyruvyl transferase WcaK-like protein